MGGAAIGSSQHSVGENTSGIGPEHKHTSIILFEHVDKVEPHRLEHRGRYRFTVLWSHQRMERTIATNPHPWLGEVANPPLVKCPHLLRIRHCSLLLRRMIAP